MSSTLTAPPVVTTDARRCEVCGESLEGRDPRAKVCSHRCAVAKSRGRKRGALRSERRCFHCGEGFTPRRSDAVFCDECRRTEPWRTASPHETCGLLRGPEFVAWLEEKVPGYRSRLNGEVRTLQRWQAGETAATIWGLDSVLVALGMELKEVPADLWRDRQPVKPPKHTCLKCGEHLREPSADDVCGFCAEEERDDHEGALAVAA